MVGCRALERRWVKANPLKRIVECDDLAKLLKYQLHRSEQTTLYNVAHLLSQSSPFWRYGQMMEDYVD